MNRDSLPSQSRIYLRVKRQRSTPDGEADAIPPRIRVKWDDTNMGGAPPLAELSALGASAAAGPTRVFRRLTCQTAFNQRVATAAAATTEAHKEATDGKDYLSVGCIRRAGGFIVMDCAGSSPAAETAKSGLNPIDDDVDVFVMDENHEKDTAVEDEDEFGFDNLVIDKEAPPTGFVKRQREEEDVPEYWLRPARRRMEESGSPDVCEVREEADGSLVHWLAGYDETLEAFVTQESEAAAKADLYCYPDHRRDDEYDSNAEDHSANEYPDTDDDEVVEDGSQSEEEAPRGNTAADGFYCEDDYEEKPLSEGWESDY